MIFLTVGTQLPFTRLVDYVDRWAIDAEEEVRAQTFCEGNWKNINAKPMVSPLEARDLSREASIIVAHAGMGSILTALEYSKPIVIVPRRADLHEHRNDHQMATARKFELKNCGGHVAYNESDLVGFLNSRNSLTGSDQFGAYAPDDFIEKLQLLIRSS